ncbi:hypothetical protein [Ideonella sp. A 288]|uniref:hypothetical protein n=1 Tax=Ideonella sp. A 288 TaxID=1962181 RepID=UPI000B4B830C|nr:hypothetical protein [Ideonella sp. A 288]
MPSRSGRSGAGRSAASVVHDLVLYGSLALLTFAVWQVSRLELFTAASDTGYWIGVAGGVCMLLLFTYPMRKRFRFMQRFGAGKPWFVAHMVLGVCGPMLILLHSTFQIGSINAGVALFSMLIVAISGVVGRFLYVRLHRNLHGEKLNLVGLRGDRSSGDAPATRLRFAPGVAQRLVDFEVEVLAGRPGGMALLAALCQVPWKRWQVERACRRELKVKVLAATRTEGWDRAHARRVLVRARRLVRDELVAVQRIAQFSAWERLFRWWHVAHVPFVYLMVLSAVAHVVAVHAY